MTNGRAAGDVRVQIPVVQLPQFLWQYRFSVLLVTIDEGRYEPHLLPFWKPPTGGEMKVSLMINAEHSGRIAYAFPMGTTFAAVRKKYRALRDLLDERGRRVWAATEASSLPRGGVSLVAQATGLSRTTIHAGIRELQQRKGKSLTVGRSRRAGGGRKPLTYHHPDLLKALEQLVDPVARGDPESFLRWTAKSTRKLAAELKRQGYRIGDRKVAELLHQMGYSLQANAKTLEGKQHPDRNAQFEYVHTQVKKFLEQGLPVISVDTKKKELVGNYSNRGQEWHPQAEPQKTLVHDFPDKELGKAIPYGIYDLGRNEGWVSVGIDHDTAEFAIDSILAWWKHMGCKVYPKAAKLLIMADAEAAMPAGRGCGRSGYSIWPISPACISR